MMLLPFKVRTVLLPNDIKAMGYTLSSEEMEAELANKIYIVVAIEDNIRGFVILADNIQPAKPIFAKTIETNKVFVGIGGKLFLLYRPNEQPIWWHEKYVIGVDEKGSAN